MQQFEPAGFFVIRTPLLPLSDFLRWSSAGNTGSYEHRAEQLRAGLRHLIARPEVREAVLVASPDLDTALDAWLADPRGDQGRRAERSLVRYVARMAARATPFGLFAGCSVGVTGRVTEIRVGGRDRYRCHSRLDMEYLATLITELERSPEIRGQLTYRPNNSIYRAAGRVRYIEAGLRNRTRYHRLVAVDDSDYLRSTLERARCGETVAALARSLVSPEISIEEATDFIHELIVSQLLVSALEPAVTGGDALPALIEKLTALAAPPPAVTGALEEVARRIAVMDSDPPGAASRSYREIATLLRPLPAKVDLPRLFQVDMTKPTQVATLGPEVVAELQRAVRLLHALTPPAPTTALDRFVERFSQRYEGREVPLAEALDEEIGIGFDVSQAPSAEASPLLRDLVFPHVSDAAPRQSRVGAYITRKLNHTLGDGAGALSIPMEEALELTPEHQLPPPPSLAVTATLAASNPDQFRTGNFRVLIHAVVGPSGARMLGRFCHTDPELERWVRLHLIREASCEPDTVYAEIVHLPEGRVGNIVQRPVLREYEIPYLGRSGATAEKQIHTSDLLVSVRAGRVHLRSRRLGRDVIPRLTAAHNYLMRNVGMYRFLGALQAQGTNGQLAWDWGAQATAAFLPRVVSGRLVLSRARWRLTGPELTALDGTTAGARFTAVQEMRTRLRLPAMVVLADADNELLTDLDNPLSVETLVHLIRRRSEAVLTEQFPPSDELWVEGPEGRFVSEVIVPFEAARHDSVPQATRHAAMPPAMTTRGDVTADHTPFPPGSEWLFLKIYCGTSTADGLLRDLVAPLVREAVAAGAVNRWFFIRYGDPDWHLRLRLHGDPARLTALLVDVQRRAQPLFADGSIARLAVDTYEPETARYGGPRGLPLVEAIFAADSEAVIAMVALLTGDAGMDARWRLAVRGADMLLEDMDIAPADRRTLMRQMRDSYRAEFDADTALRRKIGERYREEAGALLALVRHDHDADSPLMPGFDILARRSQRVRPAARELRALELSGELTTPVNEIAKSLIHLHANRLLRSAHRAQELVMYDFLDRVYTSLEMGR